MRYGLAVSSSVIACNARMQICARHIATQNHIHLLSAHENIDLQRCQFYLIGEVRKTKGMMTNVEHLKRHICERRVKVHVFLYR